MAPPSSGTGSLRCKGLKPVIGSAPVILILGSFPGETSLAALRYYAHPQNQFWQITEHLFSVDRHQDYAQRTGELVRRGIALWDVISSCRREGSADHRIRDPVFNPIERLLTSHPTIRAVAFNGAAAARYGAGIRLLECICRIPLPSTSPANTRFTLAEKAGYWEVLREFL
ncbi:MAG: DNA-deoxyinosine glycosylase [Methanoregula sp.]|nr:MAG: DNA-deoxyinosine glycosylase [Methanoregula sp.]